MRFQSISHLMTRNSFTSLPDGRRVLSVPGLFRSDYFLIPDAITEQNLRNRILRINASLLILGIAGLVLVVYLTEARFVASFILLWWALTSVIRFVLMRIDTSLSRLQITAETTYLYDNFTNKVQAGINDIPEDYEVAQYLDVLGSDDKILLLSYKNKFPLILRCRLSGSIVWKFEFKSEHKDRHATIEWKHGRVRVAGKSNYSVLLDRHTGRILSARQVAG